MCVRSRPTLVKTWNTFFTVTHRYGRILEITIRGGTIANFMTFAILEATAASEIATVPVNKKKMKE